ncbi:hypothetical protein OHJ21_01745 [Virgibacillus sp. LDC1]|uniref:hypothetical protein n=1 Tax=unclassified Paenibacillus TaxID=185978 RepID=UPI000CC3F757|nr:hypothetical protein [Paenibacillus sp. GM2FR]MCV4229874.1 hypothetical protein [Virgibacillus sp. LDC1]PJN53623.1 hypothetical protein PAEVO_03430 [Paenibacillus sp. GM2FR]
MKADGEGTHIDMLNGNGRGYPESISWNAKPGEKIYFRVLDNGFNNFNEPYTIQFTKT